MTSAPRPDPFDGPGEARRLARGIDWSATSVGPPEVWPETLRSVVSVSMASPTPMALWAGEDFTLIHNDAYAEVLGGKRSWAMGRPGREVWAEVWSAVEQEFTAVLREARSFRHVDTPYRIVRGRREEEAFFTYSLSPLVGADGRVVAVLNVTEETTHAVQVQSRTEARYRTLFDSIDEGFCIIEVLFDGERACDYRFLEVNRAFQQQTGLDQAVGRRVRELVPVQEERWFEVYGRVAVTGEPTRFELPSRSLGRTYDVYAFRAGEPEQRQVAVLFNDVTLRRQAEDALRLADQRKSDFLGVLSHELRNPLTPIRNGIHVLQQAAPGSPRAARALEVLDRQSGHLSRLVDDLLDVTRISSGKVTLQRERLELREVARDTAEDLASLFADAGVELRLSGAAGPVWIDGDRTRIAQVLGNLFQNAAKFTPPGGRVAVTIRAHEGSAELRVQDTGEGMAPGSVAGMFEPFVQAAQPLARSKGGLGLGLALVKGLVELHGGSVEGRSDGAGQGAEFVLRLPLAEAAGPRADAPAEAAAALSVLVIEDNVDAAESLAEILELAGHRVQLAHDGRSGLDRALELRPQVVLCDLGLPDIDGYEVARTLRAEARLPRARLIAVSGYARPEDRARAREAGFDAHVPKPPDVKLLLGLIAASAPA
ncbi:MAG: ATP-binding protein [Anaeromyxobacter sp.]